MRDRMRANGTMTMAFSYDDESERRDEREAGSSDCQDERRNLTQQSDSAWHEHEEAHAKLVEERRLD